MRRRIRRTAWYLAALLLAFDLPASGAEQLTHAQAINKAGRQRMLTQRIAKSYCLAGMVRDPFIAGVKQFGAQTDLAVSLFEVQLSELRAFASSADVQMALDEVTTQWEVFKPLALSPPTRQGCNLLSGLDQGLLQASEKVVSLLQDASGTARARLVNVSGRQRMLSQRIAKLYVLRAWRLAGAAEEASLEQARNEFQDALTALMDAPENTPLIRQKLDQAAEQWGWLKSALGLHRAGFPMIVNDASEKTLFLMEELTHLYTELGASP